MVTRPWYEIEDILRSKGYGNDDLFGFKQNYFDNLIEDSGYDPEDEELKRKRKLFLYGNEKEWELLKSAKSGLIRGLAEVPETGADVIEFGQKFIHGESDFANKVEAGLRGEAQQVRDAAGPFQPSSFQEKLTSNLAAVPGAVFSMAPIATPIAAATPLLAPALTATGTAALTGAAGFGLYEAIRNARGTPEEMVKGGLKGAALGAITGAAGPLTGGVGRGVKSAVLADLKGRAAAGALAGAGTGAFELATGAKPEEAAQTAATFALLSATHRNLYNKVRRAANKAGVTDPKAVEQLVEAKIEADAEIGLFLKNKKDRKRRGKLPDEEPLAPRASAVSAELDVPFSALTGGLEWGQRILRIRPGGSPSKADLTKKLRGNMSVLAYELKKEKERDPTVFDEDGNLLPEFRKEWYDKMRNEARSLVDEIKKAPDVREGSQYGVFDPSGKHLLYTVERVDWNSRSPNQFVMKDARNPGAEPKYFKSLTNAEKYLSTMLESDPEMPLGAVFNRGMSLATSDNRLFRMYGRSMLNFYAKKMGKADLAEKTMPMSEADVVQNLGRVWETPIGQSLLTGAAGRYSPAHGDITLASFKNIRSMFHEIGHEITARIFKSRFPKNPKEDEIAYGQRIKGMFRSVNTPIHGLGALFDKGELQVLFGMGTKEYTPVGATKPIPLGNNSVSSYEAEGIARFFRMKMFGEKPENSLTDAFVNSDAGRRVLQKLEAWYQGVDPIDPTKPVEVPGLGARMQETAKIFDLWRQQSPMQHTEAMLTGSRGGLLTNPLHELGSAITQSWFSHNKFIIDLQKTVWPLMYDTVEKTTQLPDWRNLDYITQFIPSSAIGQMGRNGIFNGIIPMVTGEINLKPWTQAVAESGLISKFPKYKDQQRMVNHYIYIHRLAETKKQLEAYNNSKRALTDLDYAEQAILRGEKLMSLGEILAVEDRIKLLETEYGTLLEDLGKDFAPGGKVALDPIAELARLDAEFPKAKKLIEWEEEFNAARELMGKPVRAGGAGLFKDDGTEGTVSNIGPEEFGKTINIKDQMGRAIKKHEGFSWAEQIRRNPLLDGVVEFKDPLQAGGRIIKGVDFWGTGKKRDVFTEYVMKLEEAHKESNWNRQMNEVYDVIAGQRKAGLNVGSIPDPSAVEAKIKEGKLDPHKEMLVSFRKAGRKKWIQFNPTPEGVRAYKAVTSTGPLFMGNRWADLVLGGPKRMMVLGTTGANAGFLLYTNLWRDSLTSAIQSAIKGRRGVIGVAKTLSNYAPFLIRASREIITQGPEGALKDALKRSPRDYEMTKSLLHYQATGVKGSSLIGEDIRSRDAASSEAYSRAKWAAARSEKEVSIQMAKKQFVLHTVAHPIDAMRQVLSISEDLNRFPEFYLTEKEMAASGESANPRAAKRAAEVSIDFKRAGIYGRLLNEMIPFFNPSLQGVNKFTRVLFNDQKPSLKNINKGAIAIAGQTIALPSLGLWVMNKDEEWYKELPTWEKLMFWHAKVGNHVVRVPVPFEWGLFFGTLPVAVYDSMYNDAPERVKEQMNIALKQVLPYGFVDNIPQTLKPMVEAVANKNFFTDIPIESRKMGRMLPQSRYTENTLGIYKGAGELAALLGAPELFRSPVMLEHLTRGYFGSVINGLLHDIEGVATGDTSKITGGLLFSRMFSNTDRPGQSVQDFYNKMDIADKAWNTAKSRMEAGDKAAAAKVLGKYKNKIGLSASDIRRIIVYGDMSTPESLLEMHRYADKMAGLRKEGEDKAMTETAQAALGRDWE